MLIQPRYSASVQSASFRLARITGGRVWASGRQWDPGANDFPDGNDHEISFPWAAGTRFAPEAPCRPAE